MFFLLLALFLPNLETGSNDWNDGEILTFPEIVLRENLQETLIFGGKKHGLSWVPVDVPFESIETSLDYRQAQTLLLEGLPGPTPSLAYDYSRWASD